MSSKIIKNQNDLILYINQLIHYQFFIVHPASLEVWVLKILLKKNDISQSLFGHVLLVLSLIHCCFHTKPKCNNCHLKWHWSKVGCAGRFLIGHMSKRNNKSKKTFFSKRRFYKSKCQSVGPWKICRIKNQNSLIFFWLFD